MWLNISNCFLIQNLQKNCMDAQNDSWMSLMTIGELVVPWCYTCSRWPLMQQDVLDVFGCSCWSSMQLDVLDVFQCLQWLLCCWMSWMSIDAQFVLICTKTFICKIKITLDVAWCLEWLTMHKLRPHCSWMSWISIDAQFVSWCTYRIVWLHKMSPYLAGCLWCLLMILLYLDAPRELGICFRWTTMLLDVLDV